MELIKITEQQKKILNVFSMYIQTYGTKKVRTSIEVGYDCEMYREIYSFNGENTKVNIDSYVDIDNTIFEIIDSADFLCDYYDDDNRGQLEIHIDSQDKTIKFVADIYTMDTDYSSDSWEISENDFETDSDMYKWLTSPENIAIGYARLNYEGSGDSGYIEDFMYEKKGESIKVPEFVLDWCYGKLESYGGWEINEGSQGHFEFNFAEGTVGLEHGSNYESTEEQSIPYMVQF